MQSATEEGVGLSERQGAHVRGEPLVSSLPSASAYIAAT